MTVDAQPCQSTVGGTEIKIFKHTKFSLKKCHDESSCVLNVPCYLEDVQYLPKTSKMFGPKLSIMYSNMFVLC